MIKVLYFPDIIGRPGRTAVKNFVAENKESLEADLIIANVDNVASGRGPTLTTVQEMHDAGIDVLTCGDHIWDQKEATDLFSNKKLKLIRPLNYPKIAPGKGSLEVSVKGRNIVIVSLLGRVFTAEGLDNPFTVIDEFLESAKENNIIIDFHAEATSEKMALGYYLAGRVSAVLGSHTHVQTADERILKGHTAYISDCGSNGPYDSVIGIEPEISIKRFRTGMPMKFELAEGPVQVNAVIIEIDERTGKSTSISRILEIVS